MNEESLSTKEEWYIIINHHQEGPYSCSHLKAHLKMTPDIFVWKKGFKNWVKARDVLELESLFQDDDPKEVLDDEEDQKVDLSNFSKDQEILIMNQDPFQFGFWIVLLIIIFFYLFFQIYR